MATLLEIWQAKTDEQLVDAAGKIEDYLPEGQEVIVRELERRGLPRPDPAKAPSAEARAAVPPTVRWYGWLYVAWGALGAVIALVEAGQGRALTPQQVVPQAILLAIGFGVLHGYRVAIGFLCLSASVTALGAVAGVFSGGYWHAARQLAWTALFLPLFIVALRNWRSLR
jgi:hypothetical protein